MIINVSVSSCLAMFCINAVVDTLLRNTTVGNLWDDAQLCESCCWCWWGGGHRYCGWAL